MGFHRPLVRRDDPGRPVATGAVPVRLVVPLVAAGAGSHCRIRRQADRGGVAIHAAERGVGFVLEAYIAGPGRLPGNPDDNVRRQRHRGFVFAMALPAIAAGRRLMVADLAPARAFEGEPALPGASPVTGDAIDRFVALVGEAVGGGGRGRRGRSGRQFRVTFPARRPDLRRRSREPR